MGTKTWSGGECHKGRPGPGNAGWSGALCGKVCRTAVIWRHLGRKGMELGAQQRAQQCRCPEAGKEYEGEAAVALQEEGGTPGSVSAKQSRQMPTKRTSCLLEE